MPSLTPAVLLAFLLELLVASGFAIACERIRVVVQSWTLPVRALAPATFAVPYVIVALSKGSFQWNWFLLYVTLPVATSWLLSRAADADSAQRGNWRDAVILLILGVSVDLRWFDGAWPNGLRGFGNLLLVDVGLYGFLAIRGLDGTGFDFHFRWRDWKTGFRELAFFAPVVLGLGIALGFVHPHADVPSLGKALLSWAGIFIFVAAPEELFFRAWVQNLLERRIGRFGALITASVLFGLSHFNKRNIPPAHFNWRYVVLATIAGIFYGRAWRADRRVPASTITHTCVDWLWSWWF